MLALKNISKIFNNLTAIKDISFAIKEGEVVGFLGPNGAGKTTTMRMIVGFLKPTQGEVLIDGKNPITDRTEVLKKIGYLPENNPLVSEMKVEEYLQFVVDAKGAGNGLRQIISETGIDTVIDTKIDNLSRGFKQRVGLTAALIGNPQILILDEPTSGLDPLEQEKILHLIRQLGKKRTIIMSTHILSEIEDIATRLIIINQGSIVFDDKKPKEPIDKLFKKLVKS